MQFTLLLLGLATQAFAAELPKYTGQYGVGIIDIEVAGDGTKTSDYTLKADGKPAFELQTVLTTIYYPIGNDVTANSSQEPHYWLPRPIEVIAEGFGKAAGIDNQDLVLGALSSLAGNTSIPAVPDAPLAADGGRFPVLVFGHGDTSLATWYSIWAGEMASRGHVVASVHHRDGTAAGTVVRPLDGEERNITYFRTKDVEPTPSSEEELSLAKRDFRQVEIRHVVRMIQAINGGKGEEYYRNNSRGEGQDLPNWGGRFDMTRLLITGHSFGAAAAMDSLNFTQVNPDPFTGGIVFDPGHNSGPLNPNIPLPLLIADSAEWSNTTAITDGQNHFDLMKAIATGSLDKTNGSWFLTNLGTAHVSITDAPTLAGPLLPAFDPNSANATVAPDVALARYVDVSAAFLQFLGNGTRAGVLARDATHETFVNETGAEWLVHVAPAQDAVRDPGPSGTPSPGAGAVAGPRVGSVVAVAVAMAVLCVV